MYKKITLAILSLIISASVILTPTLSAFAFGNCSLSDYTAFGYNATYFWSNNGATNIKTAGMPAYHIRLNNIEVCEWLHTVSNPNDYVGGFIIHVPVVDRYYFVIKQKVAVNVDGYYLNYNTHERESAFYYTRAFGDILTDNYDAGEGSRDRTMACIAGVLPAISPTRLWWNSYYYIFNVINSKGSSGSYISANDHPVQQYEAVKYSEMHQDELDALINATGNSDLVGAEVIGGIGEGALDELTEPAVDAESESERQSETFSKIDEMISNIDDFASIASSNQADVSSNLADVRSGLDMATGWMPWYFKAIIILGLIVIVAVKVMGR